MPNPAPSDNLFDLTGQVAVVTGTSRGLGQHFARALAKAGADYIDAYTAFAARHRFLRLLPLYWYTLYRVERSETMRS